MKRSLLLFLFSFLLLLSARAYTVDTVVIRSQAMGKDSKCVVVLPDAYAASPSKEFPVVYLLHGYGGNYANWVKAAPHTSATADMANAIIVCPDGNIGSWYFDSPVDPSYKYETYVGKEIPAFIDAHYRTIRNRKGRAIAGLSMGGHGAFFLGIRHPETFGAIVSMSGGVDFTPFPTNWDIAKRLGPYTQNKNRWEENTAYALSTQLKNGEFAISFECGESDFFIEVNRKLHDRLIERKIDHDYTERPGKHDWAYWDNAIQFQMLFLKHFFAQG